MSEFTIHTLDTAPQASRQILQNTEKQLGFIPNLYAVFAESPITLEAYQVVTELFEKTAFTATERQLVLLSIAVTVIAAIVWQRTGLSPRCKKYLQKLPMPCITTNHWPIPS
jgi:hypothetical protein